MIIVTPRLAQPADFAVQAATPLAKGREPGEAELFFLGRALDQPLERPVTPDWPS